MTMSKEELHARRRANRFEENAAARAKYAARKTAGWNKINGVWLQNASPLKRGRPPGSKNKPKTDAPSEEVTTNE